MKNFKTRTPDQGNKRKRVAFATGLGLALLWMSPVLAAAHPMGDWIWTGAGHCLYAGTRPGSDATASKTPRWAGKTGHTPGKRIGTTQGYPEGDTADAATVFQQGSFLYAHG